MKKVACVGILVADAIVETVSEYPKKGVLVQVDSISMCNGGNAMTAAINLKKTDLRKHGYEIHHVNTSTIECFFHMQKHLCMQIILGLLLLFF